MGFFDKILSSFSSPTHTADEYTDMGEGLSWFNEYKEGGYSTLSEFFGLKKENKINIKATIGKTGFYQTPEGKRWTVTAHYANDQQERFTFYCPEWTYDPINDYGEGKVLKMFVDKNDFTKYEMPIY